MGLPKGLATFASWTVSLYSPLSNRGFFSHDWSQLLEQGPRVSPKLWTWLSWKLKCFCNKHEQCLNFEVNVNYFQVSMSMFDSMSMIFLPQCQCFLVFIDQFQCQWQCQCFLPSSMSMFGQCQCQCQWPNE